VITENAQVVCRKEPFGSVCEWQGDERGVAVLSGDVVYRDGKSRQSPIGKVVRFGGLKMRVIERRISMGAYYDSFYVTLAHNPFGDLQVLYRSAAHGLLRFACNVEARVHGFMLKPYEGEVMPFTDWLYRRLL
jgi:hypothetical protein